LNTSLKIFIGFIAVLFIVSCSTKKDTFLNRSFHSVNTKYNILYNGNEAFKNGLEQLNSSYEDNYWEILPIEPLEIDELAILGIDNKDKNSPKDFEKSEEKAVKAVQKHSMLIARQERNKQIDDAYLLLGKSRYYSKRFVPALEAFNYVIINYPRASLINETKIWQSKTHIRLRNEEQAIENLTILLKDKKLPPEIIERAHTAMAMAYEAADNSALVVDHLKKATQTNFNKEQTARNLFVLGQIYSNKKLLDTANNYFQQIVDFKKAPYKYKIHAQIEKAKNASSKEDRINAISQLNKLIKDGFNKKYLDELYYQLGKIEEPDNSDNALGSYKKAIANSIQNNFQKELSYEAVGNLYFDKAQFVNAAKYYDSILQITSDDSSKRILRLKRKRNNLEDVILYEKISAVNDSILGIVAMTEEDQISFFTAHIEKLKAIQEKEQKKVNAGSAIFNVSTSDDSSKGDWYFYNIQTVGFGSQEFKRIWGNRPLEDNWRLSDKTKINFPGFLPQEDEVVSGAVNNSELMELTYYLDKIPSDNKVIDSVKNNRDNAYFRLGIIYKEQFKEINLAKSRLDKLLSFNPDLAYALPAKYHLYKIYSSENSEKATSFKNDIISNYPNSNYAKIILNPADALGSNNTNLAESEYVLVFYDYKDENFDIVIKKSSEAILKFQGDPIIPKFELLKAYAIGKKEGILAFKDALNFVAMNYPNTEEGKKALEVIETIKTKI